MANLSDLILPLRAHAPGASTALLKQAYREAAFKFFMDTTAWRDEVDTITVGANNGIYTLTPAPTGAEFFDVTRVWNDKTKLVKKTRSQMKERYDNGTTPSAFRVGAANTVYIAPAPDTDISADLTIYGVLRMTRSADVLDDEAADRFDEPLLNGARWKLLLQPQPWRDASLAEYYRKLFQDSIDIEQALAADDGQRGVRRKAAYGGL